MPVGLPLQLSCFPGLYLNRDFNCMFIYVLRQNQARPNLFYSNSYLILHFLHNEKHKITYNSSSYAYHFLFYSLCEVTP